MLLSKPAPEYRVLRRLALSRALTESTRREECLRPDTGCVAGTGPTTPTCARRGAQRSSRRHSILGTGGGVRFEGLLIKPAVSLRAARCRCRIGPPTSLDRGTREMNQSQLL